MNIIFERPTLNRKTAEENLAIVDRWIADTVDKLNALNVPEGSGGGEDVPTKLSDLQDDSGHRTVTDSEKATWNNKASKSQVNTLENNIGDLTDLETQDKDNLVDAINELAQSDNSSWGHITGDIDDQTDLQDALDDKANLNSPAFTGTPTAPTAASGTNTTQIATTAFVQGEVGSKYDVNDGVENDLQDDDKIPFYDDSASLKKKTAWSNIKAKLQAFFDGIYRKKWIAHFSGAGSSDAYCLLCTMVIQDSYINGPTEIILQERSRSTVARLNIVFQAASTTDPTLASFVAIGAQNNYYIVKTAASTWQIYVTKNEAYSWIDVIGCSIYRQNSVSITWNMQNAASVPSGAVQASMLTGVDGTKVAKTGDTMSGGLTIQNGGLIASGRPYGSGDDEGIVVLPASNGYAAVTLGSPNGRRFYVALPSGTAAPYLKFHDGTNQYSIAVPTKSGTIAVTTDIPDISTKVSKSGDTINGRLNIVFTGSDTPLYLQGNSATGTYIAMLNSSGTIMGYLYANSSKKAGLYYDGANHNFAYQSDVDAKNFIKDVGNATNTTFAYSKSGLAFGDYTWLAGWNGYELRAVNKGQFATATDLSLVDKYKTEIGDGLIVRSASSAEFNISAGGTAEVTVTFSGVTGFTPRLACYTGNNKTRRYIVCGAPVLPTSSYGATFFMVNNAGSQAYNNVSITACLLLTRSDHY